MSQHIIKGNRDPVHYNYTWLLTDVSRLYVDFGSKLDLLRL